jgi:flagellar biosynthesis protein FlhG
VRFMSRTITITSGKGGVGKTNVSLNLALYLSNNGYRVCLFDADLGLSNINILLGLEPDFDLSDLLLHGRKLEDIIIPINETFHILPGSSGLEEMANLEADRRQALIESLSGINGYDFLLFDTSAGISKNVISFCLASPEVVLVITPEPTSLTDSFALVKILSLNGFVGQIKVVINQCKDLAIATQVYRKFKSAAVKYLDIDVPTLGVIYQDENVAEAVKQQRPFLSIYPDSRASKCIRQIGGRLLTADMEHLREHDMVGFWSRCLQLISGPLKLPSTKKEGERHPSKPDLQGGKRKTQQITEQGRQGDLPKRVSGPAAIAGSGSQEPAPKASFSLPEEDEQINHVQGLPSGASKQTMNPEQSLMPVIEKLIGSISSLTKELQLVRQAIEGRKESSQSEESFPFPEVQGKG